jgi:hypothetical protein
VPAKLPNNAAGVVEDKGTGQGERGQLNASRTQCRAWCAQWVGACA